MKRWNDAVNVAGGIWLMICPWMLGFAGDERALAVASVLGAALLAAALGAFLLPQAWEKLDEVLVGLAAVGSPWMVGLQSHAAFRGSTVIVGALAILMAGLSMIADRRAGVRASPAPGPSGPSPGSEPCRR